MINYFKIKKILAKDTLSIRQLVLRDGKIPVKHCEFEDDNNPFSFHLGAIKENKIIGIISILNQSSSISKIKRLRGMAVLEGYRKIGIGSNLWSWHFAQRSSLARKVTPTELTTSSRYC